MKASWRHLGIILISTQAVGCFGVRYRDTMAQPTCDAACQTATAGSHHGHHGHHAQDEQQHQMVAYDQPMIPPRAKFHPVPTRPAFAPRVEYAPPELIRTPVLVEVPDEPVMQPTPALKPIPVEPLTTPVPLMTPPPVETKMPQPLPPPTVHARPIIAPLPQQIDLEQPVEIQPIQSIWRTKQST